MAGLVSYNLDKAKPYTYSVLLIGIESVICLSMPPLDLQPILPLESGVSLSDQQKGYFFRPSFGIEAKNLPICTCYVKHSPSAPLSIPKMASTHCTALRKIENVPTGQALLLGNHGLATVLFVKNHKEYISNVNFS
jgi:hypothetical protein